ncbi:hypothetical protein ABZ635_04220 [Nocardiopsis sp. NPDC007018]|uniref:hypothetical protein n=1 Tax=Nocardiopsis sp. NPDC007018 TaxID=3155721 RepID=UPI00340DE571
MLVREKDAPMELIGLSRVRQTPDSAEACAQPSGTVKEPSSFPRRLISWALLLLLPLILLTGSTGTAHANEDDIDGLSFYRLSSSLTALFSTAQEPDSAVNFDAGNAEGWSEILSNPASAGSMLGYADENYNPISGWLNSRVAQSSDSVGYNTLLGVHEGDDGARNYALFGATLNGLGLDSTSTGLSIAFMNMFAGGIILFLYTAMAFLDLLWSWIISFLIFINPFKLFYWAVNGLNPQFADGMVGGEPPEGFLGEISQWFGEWYLVLVNISWTVMVPLFVATFLLGIMMFQKLNKGGVFKKLVIRLLFLVLGLPLLGSMYTGMLNAMEVATEGQTSGGTRVVLSTFVDFERWATDQRLRIPDQSHGVFIEWNHYSSSPSGRSQTSVRDLALLINAQVLKMEGELVPQGSDADEIWGGTALGGEEPDLSEAKYEEISDMLKRYMRNSHVLGSSFETEAKSTLRESSTSCQPDAEGNVPENCSNERTWFEEYIGDPEDVVKTEGNLIPVEENPLLAVAPGTGLVAYSDRGTDNVSFSTQGDDVQDCGLNLSARGSPRPCNLSPMAMYNYLNTDFGETSYTAYSSGKTTSEATRSIHNSVNLVGSGLMSLVYWLHAVVVLGAFVVIGYGYAFAMIMGNLRRSFQLITAVPFATLGVISGITKVIVYTIALLMEVVITLFLYMFVQEFLLSIPSIIQAPFVELLDSNEMQEAAFLAFLASGGFIMMIITSVSILVIILLTVMAMRLRKTMVKAVEDASSKLVEKFTGESGGAGGGGAPGATGGRLPGGASPGMKGGGASRTMSGGAAKGGSGASAGGTSGGPASSNSTVTGDVDTDGTLEGPGGSSAGDDHSGSGLGSNGEDREADGQAQLGRRVESEGLSDDPSEALAKSVDDSAQRYADADKSRAGAAVEGTKAVGNAAAGTVRGMSGDSKGALEHGRKAVMQADKANRMNAAANRASQQAGQSSLDSGKTSASHEAQSGRGHKVSQGGRTLPNATSSPGGGTGGSTGSGAGAKKPGPGRASAPKPTKKRRLW